MQYDLALLFSIVYSMADYEYYYMQKTQRQHDELNLLILYMFQCLRYSSLMNRVRVCCLLFAVEAEISFLLRLIPNSDVPAINP